MSKQPHGRRSRARQRGQGMTEYVIIVALIAIGTIAIVSFFGDNIRAVFGASAQALAGPDEVSIRAQSEAPDGALKKNMKDFAGEE